MLIETRPLNLTEVADHARQTIIGNVFKQLSPFERRIRGSHFRRNIFYNEPITIDRKGKRGFYSVKINGIQQTEGGMTYYQLRKHFIRI